MKLIARNLYSYRGDEAVLAFDDSEPIVFMDGECVLCTRSAQLLARLDWAGIFASARSRPRLGAGFSGIMISTRTTPIAGFISPMAEPTRQSTA